MKRNFQLSLTILTAVSAISTSVFAGVTDIQSDAKAELAARRALANASQKAVQVSSQQSTPATTPEAEPAKSMDLNLVLQAIADDNHDQNITKVVIVYKDGTKKTFTADGVKVSGNVSSKNDLSSFSPMSFERRPIGPDNNPGLVNKYRRGGQLGY